MVKLGTFGKWVFQRVTAASFNDEKFATNAAPRRRNAWMALNEDEESLAGFGKCKLILALPLAIEPRWRRRMSSRNLGTILLSNTAGIKMT